MPVISAVFLDMSILDHVVAPAVIPDQRAYNRGMSAKVYHDPGKQVKPGTLLGVFARFPAAGTVKTRLASQTSSEWAARVAAAFLADTLHRFASLSVRRVLVHTPDCVANELAPQTNGRFSLEPQGNGDLGQRLARFFDRHAVEGPVVVVGSDSPTLPLAFVEQAILLLETADVILGPATDGGYYLLGSRRPIPALFSGIDWSGPCVLTQTIERLPADVRLALLPPWYDVDTLDDFRMLVGHIAALRRAGIDPLIPRTEALIQEGTP
jgi:rSAM/selenodomain-associated transferase 1